MYCFPTRARAFPYQVEIQGRPDVFQQLRPYATITYGHNSSYTGNDEEEFAYDEEEGALQSKSQGMGNSEVWVSIKLKDDAPAGNISFWYKTDSESNYDYLLLGSYAYGATKYNQTEWTQVSFSLQPGKEQLLTFRKDSSGEQRQGLRLAQGLHVCAAVHASSLRPFLRTRA